MNNELDINYFKEKLLAEKDNLEKELSHVGRINPDNPGDWEATPGDINDRSADPNKLADNIEEYEARTATLKELEDQLKDVTDALKKIEDGTYGVSEISGNPIQKERLEAYPAARTTKEEVANKEDQQ
jgi:RNA polymerase-binding transcription factor DksA